MILVGEVRELDSVRVREDVDSLSVMATVFERRMVGFHVFKLRVECGSSLSLWYTLLALLKDGRLDIVQYEEGTILRSNLPSCFHVISYHNVRSAPVWDSLVKMSMLFSILFLPYFCFVLTFVKECVVVLTTRYTPSPFPNHEALQGRMSDPVESLRTRWIA